MVNFEKGNFTRSDGTILFDKGALKADIIRYLLENDDEDVGYTIETLIGEIIRQGYLEEISHYELDQIYGHRIWNHKEIIDLGNRLKNFIKHMIFPEGILDVTKRGNFRYLTLSTKYLENETKDFSLDESKHYETIDSKIVFDDEALKNKIIKALLDSVQDKTDLSDVFYYITVDILGYGDGKEPYLTKWKAFREKLQDLVTELEAKDIVRTEENEWDEICAWISPDYIAKETESFNLDEALVSSRKKYYVFGDDGKISFDKEGLKGAIINSLTNHDESDDDLLDGTSINNLIYWTLYDIMGEYPAEHDVDAVQNFMEIWNALYDEVSSLISELIRNGVLLGEQSEWEGREYVKISPEYVAQQTKDFTLDEAWGFKNDDTIDDNLIPTDESARADVIETIALSLGPVHEENMLALIQNYLMQIHASPNFRPNRKQQASARRRAARIIKQLIKDKIVMRREGDWGYELAFAPGYIESETSNFSLDESSNKKNQQYELSDDEMKNVILKLIYEKPDVTQDMLMFIADRYGLPEYRHSKLSIGKFNEMLETVFKQRKPQVRRIIDQLLDDGSILSTTRDDAIWYYDCFALSDYYLQQQTKDFSLDESLRVIIRKIISENVMSLSNTRNAAE